MTACRKRDEAVSGLKASLVQRFGRSARNVVEVEVDDRLATTGGKLTREDLDAIEQSILQRTRGVRKLESRSAPALGLAETMPRLSSGMRRQGDGRRATALETVAAARRIVTPSSTGAAGSTELPRPRPKAVSLQPPYGISVIGNDDPVSERGQRVDPRFPVPLRPKLKPMDHWDLIAAFDAHKHRQEDDAFFRRKKALARDTFKATLDEQMGEVRAYREMDEQARCAERDQVLAEAEDNRRRQAAEHDKLEEKKRALKADNLEILKGIAQQRQREKDKKQNDAQRMSDWLEKERQMKEREDRDRAEEHAAKCKQAREQMQALQEAAAARKKALQESERTYVEEQKQRMDDAAAAGRQEIMERMAKIEKNTATLGKEIAERDAKAEKELQDKIRRVQEQSDREAKEDAERRKATKDRKTAEMLASLKEQCQKRAEDAVVLKEDDHRQARVFRDEYEKGLQKDRADAERRRLAREHLDAALIDQMRAQIVVHPKNFGITDETQEKDVAYNRMFYEQMDKEGFMPTLTKKMVASVQQKKAQKDKEAVVCKCDLE